MAHLEHPLLQILLQYSCRSVHMCLLRGEDEQNWTCTILFFTTNWDSAFLTSGSFPVASPVVEPPVRILNSPEPIVDKKFVTHLQHIASDLRGKAAEEKGQLLKESTQLIATISHPPNNPFKRQKLQQIGSQVSKTQQNYIDLEAHSSTG